MEQKVPGAGDLPKTVHISDYAAPLQELLTQLQVEYGYNHTDAMLVLKDILARVWKGQI